MRAEMSESVGKRIKALRVEQGLTLARLSQKANISTSYLSQIERDRTTPSLNTLMGIARAFNVGLRYFFETDDEVARIVRARDDLDGDEPCVVIWARSPSRLGCQSLTEGQAMDGWEQTVTKFFPMKGTFRKERCISNYEPKSPYR
jgi:transcriptional regulator with XRE-family HTH domain